MIDFPNVMPIRDRLWREGVPLVRAITGISEAQARSLIGKLVKDDCARVWDALQEANSLRPVGPRAWLIAACGRRSAPDISAAQMLDFIEGNGDGGSVDAAIQAEMDKIRARDAAVLASVGLEMPGRAMVVSGGAG